MQIIRGIEQGSPEWHKLRLGIFTATDGQALGAQGKGLETLAAEKAAEVLIGGAEELDFENSDMERGKELEDIARTLYILETGQDVQQVAFILGDLPRSGSSPDGLVGEDGLVEIKCPNRVRHLNILRFGAKGIDTKYIWQMQKQMLDSGRKWCDFISYNADYENIGKDLIIIRIFADAEKQDLIRGGLKMANEKLEQILKELNK